MKALSVKNPYANLIRLGLKTIETRSKNISYRGDVLICASKSKIYAYDVFNILSVDLPTSETYCNEGMAICVATLFHVGDFVKQHELDAFVRFDESKELYAWHLENIRAIMPFPVKGKLGFFEVDDSLIQFI